jgi:hypothetical protein
MASTTRFALQAASSSMKRTADTAQASARAKAPRASEVRVEQGPKPVERPHRLPVVAPICVCIYKVTNDAGDVWGAHQGKGIPLFQIQIDHPAQNSLTFQMRDAFADFLRAAKLLDESVPGTLQELERDAGIRLQITGSKDPDGVGFVQWRPAFYVAGNARNFLMLLGDFFKHKEALMARASPFEVALLPHTNVGDALGENLLDDFPYEHTTLAEPTAALPLGIFEAQPVVGQRVLTLNLERGSEEDQLSVVITGPTWGFRGRLDASGVAGGFSGGEDDPNRRYVRILRNLDASTETDQSRVLDLLGDKVFNGLAVRVILDREPEPDSAIDAFTAKLRELPSLHFVT